MIPTGARNCFFFFKYFWGSRVGGQDIGLIKFTGYCLYPVKYQKSVVQSDFTLASLL